MRASYCVLPPLTYHVLGTLRTRRRARCSACMSLNPRQVLLVSVLQEDTKAGSATCLGSCSSQVAEGGSAPRKLPHPSVSLARTGKGWGELPGFQPMDKEEEWADSASLQTLLAGIASLNGAESSLSTRLGKGGGGTGRGPGGWRVPGSQCPIWLDGRVSSGSREGTRTRDCHSAPAIPESRIRGTPEERPSDHLLWRWKQGLGRKLGHVTPPSCRPQVLTLPNSTQGDPMEDPSPGGPDATGTPLLRSALFVRGSR